MQQPVIIVGGGFGGVYTAKHLLKKGIRVLLISEHNYFTFTPLLHEVATGSLTRSDVIFEYESFFQHPKFEFFRGKVLNIDFKQRKVLVGKKRFQYADVVLATGADTNYFNLKGKEHVLPMKTIEEATEIKKRLVELGQGSAKRVYVNIIGGGPTGVELALEIGQFLRFMNKRTESLHFDVRIIQGDKTILSFFDPKLQAYAVRTLKQRGIKLLCGAFAKEATSKSIITTKGTFHSNLTIMAGGVVPQTQCAEKSFLDEKAHVRVDDFLRIEGASNAFALGDIITQNNRPLPKLAQTAVQQAKIVAENIARKHRNKPYRSYRMRLAGTAISLGNGRGAVRLFGVMLTGFLGWWLWRTIYLFKTPGLRNKLRVAFSWTLNLFQGRSLAEE